MPLFAGACDPHKSELPYLTTIFPGGNRLPSAVSW